MKWYDPQKKKPKNRDGVAAFPPRPYPVIIWWEKYNCWYGETPWTCYSVSEPYRWAYIKYPKLPLWYRIKTDIIHRWRKRTNYYKKRNAKLRREDNIRYSKL